VLVDVPMDIFSADLPVDAFNKQPAPIAKPTIDRAIAELIVDALANAERPVLYAGGGVLSARASGELVALAEALDLPIAHTLMGTGVVPTDHPLLLGMTGFWGTPIANRICGGADVMSRSAPAEANSSPVSGISFTIPPTRLIHIDGSPEIGCTT
jgi:acetolactate synthase-1/2/3 large subunit